MQSIDRIPDPLIDRFGLAELPRIAPWVFEELALMGLDEVRERLARLGFDPEAPQLMSTWIKVVTEQHGPLWEALQVA